MRQLEQESIMVAPDSRMLAPDSPRLAPDSPVYLKFVPIKIGTKQKDDTKSPRTKEAIHIKSYGTYMIKLKITSKKDARKKQRMLHVSPADQRDQGLMVHAQLDTTRLPPLTFTSTPGAILPLRRPHTDPHEKDGENTN